MNLFQKNPFANKISQTKIAGKNPIMDEAKKLENIKEKMIKLKFQKQQIQTPQKTDPQKLTVKDKIDILRNINK